MPFPLVRRDWREASRQAEYQELLLAASLATTLVISCSRVPVCVRAARSPNRTNAPIELRLISSTQFQTWSIPVLIGPRRFLKGFANRGCFFYHGARSSRLSLAEKDTVTSFPATVETIRFDIRQISEQEPGRSRQLAFSSTVAWWLFPMHRQFFVPRPSGYTIPSSPTCHWTPDPDRRP